jgi:hypothetical protein
VFAAIAFVFLHVNSVDVIFAEDEAAIRYGTERFLESGRLDIDNSLNEAYNTNVVGNPFTAYRTGGDFYHRVSPGTVLLFAPFVAFGDVGFYLTGPLFGALAAAAVFFLALRVSGSYAGASAAAAGWIAAPVFTHWGSNYFNNVPVLSIELWALYFLAGPRPTVRRAAAGGALMGLAVFVRPQDALLLPLVLGFVALRTRALRPIAAYLAPVAAFVALIALTNQLFYGSASFLPAIGPLYLPIPGGGGGAVSGGVPGVAGGGSGPALGGVSAFERYVLHLLGTQTYAEFSLSDKLDNWWYHLRYLAGSSFAFPLLLPGIAGLALGIVRREWRAIQIAALLAIFVLFVVGLYGNQESNYFGYGEDVVRSSFVRYSLPIYALAAVGIACGWAAVQRLATHRQFGGAAQGILALVVAVGCVAGVRLSFDPQYYGFDRFNALRHDGANQRTFIDRVVQTRAADGKHVLVLAGPRTSKLVDMSKHPDTIDYDHVPRAYWDRAIAPAIRGALEDQIQVTIAPLILDASNRPFLDWLETRFVIRDVWVVSPKP